MPCFVAEYVAPPAAPILPATDAITTTRPKPAAVIAGSADQAPELTCDAYPLLRGQGVLDPTRAQHVQQGRLGAGRVAPDDRRTLVVATRAPRRSRPRHWGRATSAGTTFIAAAVIAEASLSFLGLGAHGVKDVAAERECRESVGFTDQRGRTEATVRSTRTATADSSTGTPVTSITTTRARFVRIPRRSCSVSCRARASKASACGP